MADRTFRAVDLAAERGDRRLFEHLNFTLSPGQLLQVSGRNGSGKTSLLRILSGLSRPAEGQVFWGEEPIQSVDGGTGSCLGYLGHLNALKDDLSATENITSAGRIGGSATDPDAALGMLERIGLAGYEDLPARFLSQGQKRRVALARLLLQRRPLWILDEPYAALDVQVIEVLRASIESHLTRSGMIIITTHQAVDIDGDCHNLHLG
ncbi:ABC transporter involved in cytochrome c biogenesis, ATPase component CcmA [Thioalkalivibrio nitratireducens DSM 14787]|uniref:ABC transporter involved in cytochrome c biogenesis, ATPase component CcmA n=2 Tax=Thioalkalivibrio nitratireducens TaxID=186931 RepID=L0DXF0_THIND|nr:cytochrome c biogenesis heme-transporting ATPase CcmA [Thioalkalivibrio nitratireducens]AGA33682.1 ABC transporter involved in cytochrome c biogenesis, ATPase component CcmA [Thioalkalivibrio nitratireducens DSM 14787]